MSGYWAIAVNVLFPVPLICLLLLCLPLPKGYNTVIRKYVLALVDKVLFTQFAGGINLYRLCTVLSALLFLGTSWETVRAAEKLNRTRSMLDVQFKEEKQLCYKWRAERNFWIAMFSLVLWLILYRVRNLTHEIYVARTALKEHESKAN